MIIDSSHANNELAKIIDKLDNPSLLMQKVGDYLLNKANARFISLNGVDGNRWKENAPATIKQKGHKIMLTGKLYPPKPIRLRNSLRVELSRMGIELGTVLDYAKFNNEGTDRIPKREFLGVNHSVDTGYFDKLVMEYLK